MSMKPTDTIIGPRRGTADQAMTFARKIGATRQDDLAMYLSTVYTLAPKLGIDPAIVVAQSALETSNWTDRWWTDRLNPAGIGITGDAAQNAASMTWENGEDAAIGQIIHLYLYAKGWPLPPELAPYTHLDPRRTAIHASNLGNVRTLEDLGTRWAVVADYGQRISNRAAAIFPDLPDQTVVPEEPAMGYTKHTWPGLNVPVYLPDWIVVEIKIIPSSVAGWTSGTKSNQQVKSTWHDTANEISNADGEYRWAAGGGRAKVPGSYNGIYDGKKLIITQRFDEMVGHAANNTGNYTSYAFEQAFGPTGGGFEASLTVGTYVHGGLIAAKGWSVDTALVKHQDWSGKWCPGQILNRSLWSQAVARTSEAARLALGAAAGDGVPTPPVYPKPVTIPELEAYKGLPNNQIPYRVNGDGWVAIYVGDRVAAAKQTRRMRYALGTEDVGPLINPGEQFDVDWLLISTEFPDTYYTPYATRVVAEDTTRISDMKGTGE